MLIGFCWHYTKSGKRDHNFQVGHGPVGWPKFLALSFSGTRGLAALMKVKSGSKTTNCSALNSLGTAVFLTFFRAIAQLLSSSK